MWTCPKCKMTNDNCKCRNCGFDASRDYRHHRFLCQLSGSASKISKQAQSGENILMASRDTDCVFGRKMDRKQITAIYFLNKKENIGEDAWDVSEKQNGSIMAWTEEKRNGFMDLYLAANGNILANKDCSSLFKEYRNLKKFVGLQYFQTNQTENMKGMFTKCWHLKSLNVRRFDTSQVTNMYYMFAYCTDVKTLNVSHFNTSRVTDMSHMFCGCRSLKSLDLLHFNTSQVKNMSFMFSGCENLKNLDLNHFVTDKVTDMSYMFESCYRLESLDLRYFDTSQVTNLDKIFYNCISLNGGEGASHDYLLAQMFYKCISSNERYHWIIPSDY